jgi:hypothetical protein
LTLHDPIRDYKTRSKLCGLLEHELSLAQDNHQRGQTRGNDVTPKSGQESFQAWLARHAQGFIDATTWEEFHGIADAHGVRLSLRETASSLRICARGSTSKRARLTASWRRRRLKLASVLLFPLSTNRGGMNKGTSKGLGSGASILRDFGKNTRCNGNCTKHCGSIGTASRDPRGE